MRVRRVGWWSALASAVAVGAAAPVSVASGARPEVKRLPTPTVAVAGSASRAAGRVLIQLRGSITVRPGLDRAAACRGSVAVLLTAARKLLATRAAHWTSTCRFTLRIRLSGRAAAGVRRVVVSAHFSGSTIVGAATDSATLVVR